MSYSLPCPMSYMTTHECILKFCLTLLTIQQSMHLSIYICISSPRSLWGAHLVAFLSSPVKRPRLGHYHNDSSQVHLLSQCSLWLTVYNASRLQIWSCLCYLHHPKTYSYLLDKVYNHKYRWLVGMSGGRGFLTKKVAILPRFIFSIECG